MGDIWFSSDHHFGHKNILKFLDDEGNPIRKFDDLDHMHEELIERHNSVVKPGDKWYCMGDVGFNRTVLDQVLPRMNGKKRLLLGNHDDFKMDFYMKYFQKIALCWRPTRDIIFSHMPHMFEDSHGKIKMSVHGHTHTHKIPDNRYLNLCVEQINYTPVNLDYIRGVGVDRGLIEV